ncbi:MAG: protein translocase subunit SecD [Lachnospiraceae bacterium]|nr:protein translocase subunit SecD [Lachnospiraceae bacterium]
MKKRTGIITFIAMILVTALMLFTALKGWGVGGTGSMKNIKTGLDLSGGVSITYEAAEENPSSSDMDDTKVKLQKRVEQYSTESNVYREGSTRINVEIPGVTNANEILEDLGTPGSLYFIAQTDADGNQNYSYSSSTGTYELNKTIDELKENGSIVCEGGDVQDAQGGIQQDSTTKNNKYVVELTFTSEGTEKFGEGTTAAYEKGESIGIYYDGAFVSVPRVNAAITDGKAIIEGMSSIEEARELASYIRIGGLKVTLNEIRSNVVGAQLGQTAIQTSLRGGAVGLVLVMIIMIAVYLLPGAIASFSLLLYVAMMLVLLNAFDLTLTLPGIAGIILSIGMAVDANVIIFSRLQEELSYGASVRGAINAGFSKAMSAIVDGNITTLIAAAVLGLLGTGSIKGFAMTLALGVALSMFTALVITRLLINAVYALGVREKKLWAREKKLTSFSFIRNRMKYLVFAGCILVIGIGCMIFHASKGERELNYSLEFLGGTASTVDFNTDYTLAELDAQVKPVIEEVTGDSNISMQKVVGSNEVIIKTRALNVDERQTMAAKLLESFGVEESSIKAESISATVGKEMRRSAIQAVLLAVVLMLLYIFIRFKDMRFATSAVLALCHDVLITLMAYAILRISVGNAFIAVMLTILGYSINSTIVIFDRIREALPQATKSTNLEELVDRAVNMTLTRSIFTNLTTLSSICVLYVVGVSSIKEFTLPMMVGILAGACSSVFLTGPLWYWMRTTFGKDAKEYAAAAAARAKADAAKGAERAADAKAADVTAAVRTGGNPNVIRKKKTKKSNRS